MKMASGGGTSNPAIFEQAISANSDYDEDIEEFAKSDADPENIYYQLAIKDIQAAADFFSAGVQRGS